MMKKIIILCFFSAILQQAAAQSLPKEAPPRPITAQSPEPLFDQSREQAAEQAALPGAVQPSAQSPARLLELYRNRLQGQSLLYQGREYSPFDNRILGHPFFLSREWSKGSILYDEVLYENVSLRYDVAREELIVLHMNEYVSIKLINDRISWFSLAGQTFIHLRAEGSGEAFHTSPENGFYQKLYEGKLNEEKLLVLARRNKIVHKSKSGMELIREFRENDLIYIRKEGVYYLVGGKRSVLRVLSDQKKELREFLRKHKIKYRKDPEAAIVKMVGFYERQGH